MPLKQTVCTFFICLLAGLQSMGQQWQFSQQYTPPDVRSNNLFGNAVDIDGNYAIASAHRHSPVINGDTLTQSGAAYIFEKEAEGNWNEAQKLTAPDAVAYDYFGMDVGISGTTAVVGAHYNSSDTDNENPMPAAGAVYVFERAEESGTWQFWQKLTASDRDTLDWFGQSLSIHQNRLIVGAPGEDEDAEGNNHLQAAGSAYIFEKANDGYWYEQQKLVPEFRETEAQFGLQVKIYNDNVVVRHLEYTERGTISHDAQIAFSYVDNQWHYTQLFNLRYSFTSTSDLNDDYLVFYDPEVKTYAVDGISYLQVEAGILVYQKDSENKWKNIDTINASAPRTGFGSSLSINNNNEIFTRERGINILENGDTIEGDWLQHFILDSIKQSWNIDEQFFIERLAVQEIAYSENEAIITLGFGLADKNVIFVNNEIPTSIPSFGNLAYKLSIYPNPFQQQFYIELPDGSHKQNVTIYNSLMQSIPFSFTKNNNKLTIKITQNGQLFYIQHQHPDGFITNQPVIKF